jgi:hypothetical protein
MRGQGESKTGELYMADVVLNPKTSALLLQDLQNALIKGSRP